jgi:endonuclease/exonuclease/phosphatase (EEP) superfamily protein YafD
VAGGGLDEAVNAVAGPRSGCLGRLRAAGWWLLAGSAAVVVAIGLLAPSLGAPDPGLPGRFGYWAETITALWRPLGSALLGLAIAAWWCRRRRPAIAFVVLAVLALWPELWSLLPRGLRGGSGAGAGPALRIATVNLNEFGEDEAAMVTGLRQLDCDVLVLLEFTPRWERVLAAQSVGDHVHRVISDPGGAHTDGLRVAIWSRHPFAGEPETCLLRGYNAQLRAPIVWQERTFWVHAVHPLPPLSLQYAGVFEQRRQLLDWLRTSPRPRIVAGDLNAAPRSALRARLHELGWRSAGDDVHGQSPGTWPMDRAWAAPFRLAIDQILVDDHFVVDDCVVGPANGSDHAPLLATIRWRAGR